MIEQYLEEYDRLLEYKQYIEWKIKGLTEIILYDGIHSMNPNHHKELLEEQKRIHHRLSIDMLDLSFKIQQFSN